jgi:hypothetical protein
MSEYESCPDCGAEIYDDGTHVLDAYDRKVNGYPICTTRKEES